jgi:putative redox protein
VIDCETETPNELRQILHIGPHVLHSDGTLAAGGKESAPTPHDLFDAALAACTALTTTMYARARGIPLERVETHVERDDSNERKGVYVLRVRAVFHGPLSDEQRQKLHEIAERCPIHKLMTSSEVKIEATV